MPALKTRTPKLCRHSDGRAFVKIDGRQIMLGKYGDPLAQEKYDRVVSEWLANGRRQPPPPAATSNPTTISIVVNEYRRHSTATQTPATAASVWLSIKPVWELYGSTPAGEFGPLKLKAVRNRWIESGLGDMSKVTWVCFDCREAVRREAPHAQEVTCAFCGKQCRCIGHTIPTPRKSAVKQWEVLRESLNEHMHHTADERFRSRVRCRHDLEQVIARLEAKPSNPGRAKAIRLLRRQLEGA